MPGIFLYFFPPYFLRYGLPLRLGLNDSARLACLSEPQDLPVSTLSARITCGHQCVQLLLLRCWEILTQVLILVQKEFGSLSHLCSLLTPNS